ncbi:glycosyltransferase family 4 protein [Alistipes finegoldii]
MKVLWFAVTPSLYETLNKGHNGGGWIASLEQIVRSATDIRLGIAFEHSDRIFKKEIDDVCYYPINVNAGLRQKTYVAAKDKAILAHCLKIIEDFQPDIIHVFGSEWCFGLVEKYTNIPVVIHMQGSLPPYANAAFPPGYNFFTQWRNSHFSPIVLLKKWLVWNKNDNYQTAREIEILKHCRYVMGRTEWDYNITRLYAPDSQYYHCNEALRPIFLAPEKTWSLQRRKKLRLLSVGSCSMVKGMDLLLKTARLLKGHTHIDFEWRIAGPTELFPFFESNEDISHETVNIKFLGTLSAENLAVQLAEADIYIHTSYMDNSPNSICEAQIIGIPVITTYVGGIPSLVKNKETGILVPSNEPHTLAMEIIKLSRNTELMNRLSDNERQTAGARHNPDTIKNTLTEIYRTILSQHHTSRLPSPGYNK